MKYRHFLSLLATCFLVFTFLFSGEVYAQSTSVSGDDICGAYVDGKITKPCGVDAFKTVTQNIFSLIISIGLPLLIVFIIYRFVMAWYAAAQGNANAYQDATKKVTNAIVGFIIIVLIAGGALFAMIKMLNINPSMLKVLNSISVIGAEKAYAGGSCVKATEGQQCFMPNVGGPTGLYGKVTTTIYTPPNTHCADAITNTKYTDVVTDCTGVKNGTPCDVGDYNHTFGLCSGGTASTVTGNVSNTSTVDTGAGTVAPSASNQNAKTQLPNPLGFSSLYDFILGVLNMVLKFFLYPALIGIWVFAGLLYVTAQGAPEKIAKAHKLLFWAFITTLIVFTAQAFLVAAKGSVEKIIPTTTSTATNIVSPIGTVDGRVAPKDGELGSSCKNETTGLYGQYGEDGECITGGRR